MFGRSNDPYSSLRKQKKKTKRRQQRGTQVRSDDMVVGRVECKYSVFTPIRIWMMIVENINSNFRKANDQSCPTFLCRSLLKNSKHNKNRFVVCRWLHIMQSRSNNGPEILLYLPGPLFPPQELQQQLLRQQQQHLTGDNQPSISDASYISFNRTQPPAMPGMCGNTTLWTV